MTLADHVWQSTLFLVGAALLTLGLRKNQARVRYWVWLAASLKFLVPFTLLVAIGSHLGWLAPSASAPPTLAAAVEAVSQPFSRAGIAFFAQTEGVGDAAQAGHTVLPSALLTIWLTGFAAMLVAHWRAWRPIGRAIRGARRLTSGREFEALSRARQTLGVRTPVTLLSSPSFREPSVAGLIRPAVLWPAAVSDLLEDEELDAILSHELTHVRRRDNLTGALHMAVGAAFWFHPLVWWLTARLVEERERSCDEAVLALGARPEPYAEGLLKVCRFGLRSPMPCVTGVTDSNITQRIEHIMSDITQSALSRSKRFLLSVSAVAVLAAPVAAGAISPASPRAVPAASTQTSDTIYTPGNGVSAPVVVSRVNPHYTLEAMQAKIQGDVWLQLVVQPDGTVMNIKVLRSLDRIYGLDQAAIDAAKKWLFRPGEKDGSPVPVRVTMQMSFQLRDSPPAAPETTASEFGRGAHREDEPGIVLPRVRSRVNASYTPEALNARIQGQVHLEAVVLADGTVGDARIVGSLDTVYGLDEAALAAVRQSTFEPATLNGRAVPIVVAITMQFRVR
jgi:TonB family protein